MEGRGQPVGREIRKGVRQKGWRRNRNLTLSAYKVTLDGATLFLQL